MNLKKILYTISFQWTLAYVSIKSSSKVICFHLTPQVSAFGTLFVFGIQFETASLSESFEAVAYFELRLKQ